MLQIQDFSPGNMFELKDFLDKRTENTVGDKDRGWFQVSLHTKRSFPLRVSSANVTTSAVSCGFGHIY